MVQRCPKCKAKIEELEYEYTKHGTYKWCGNSVFDGNYEEDNWMDEVCKHFCPECNEEVDLDDIEEVSPREYPE